MLIQRAYQECRPGCLQWAEKLGILHLVGNTRGTCVVRAASSLPKIL